MRKQDYPTLAAFISAEWFNTYLRMADADEDKVIEYYIKNISRSQEVYNPIHWLEIGLRNKMNQGLSDKYGDEWYDHPHMQLRASEKDKIQKAKVYLRRDNKSITNANFVAERGLMIFHMNNNRGIK